MALAPGHKEWASVLKITRHSRKGRMLTLKLEGEILEPWVSSVRDACAPPGRRSERLCLDLAAVTYADAAGAQLLRELLRDWSLECGELALQALVVGKPVGEVVACPRQVSPQRDRCQARSVVIV